MSSWLRGTVLVAAVTLAGTAAPGLAAGSTSTPVPAVARRSPEPMPLARKSPEPMPLAPKPLAGVVIALDPGHQLGNGRHPREINRPVAAGGFTKPCNTTGTATRSGVPEATVTWRLAKQMRARLRALGATVKMTRTSNSRNAWGPCVDARGAFPGKVGAQLMVSLHADGAASSAHGFHVIVPTRRAPWTTRTAAPSLRLGTALRDGLTGAGVPRSSYIGAGTALSVRSDLGTLNTSQVPVAMIEVGNMLNPSDARRMTTASGRTPYVAGVVTGIRRYLGR